MILTGTVVVAGLMFVLWLIHFPMRNAAIVDAGWAGGLAILGVLYAVLGDGFETRRYLIGAMAAIWGFRLAIHLLTDRIIGHPEEGRYQELRREWKTHIGVKFLVFFEFQALLCVVLSAPFYLSSRNGAPALSILNDAGVAVWAIGILGEALTPCALFAIGLDLSIDELRGHLSRYALLAALKLIAMPLVVYGLCVAVGLDRTTTLAAVICAAVPTAKSAYVLAVEYDVEKTSTGAAISTTTLFSIVTLLAWLYLL